jgi:cell division septation protein DedD
MLFDRFNFRERESGMPEEEPVLTDLPAEGRSYAFTLDTRQIVFLIAGYCFLCVLVFALGMVVGRATNQPEPVAQVAKADDSTPSLPREQPAKGQPSPSASGRIPLIPTPESKKTAVQTPEFAFSPTLPESALTSRGEGHSATTPARPRATSLPEAVSIAEPPDVKPDVKVEDRREPEPRRPAVTADTKPKPPTATRVSLSQGGDYTIQVGSSRSLEQATELKGRLSKKGYVVYVQTVDLSDKGTWHRVRVGNYRDKEGAERVASDIRSRESLPATVMKK